ncbi:DUF6265 family protein [Leptobacterium sp. I13]|uniref:DUF6265 family protein n=1 Tax=Leptobacterium meishanense TaxID=3128904 RepID=UPI0030EB6800
MRIIKTKKQLLIIVLILITKIGYAQQEFQNTLVYDSLIGSPKASLKDIQWMEGSWRGKAFGGITEEVWTPPLGGTMMGAFKLVVNNKPSFYELLILSEENETLMLRLKHFHANLMGWEEKDKTVDFPLVKVTPNKVYFDQFTFEKVDDNEVNLYVVISNRDKNKREVKFNYKRTKE